MSTSNRDKLFLQATGLEAVAAWCEQPDRPTGMWGMVSAFDLRMRAAALRAQADVIRHDFLHPITVESNAHYAMSELTGLTWLELRDQEVLWFINRGRMRPTAHHGVGDTRLMTWSCQIHPCTFVSARYARGGSRNAKEAVRQHLRDKHDLIYPPPIRPSSHGVDRGPDPDASGEARQV